MASGSRVAKHLRKLLISLYNKIGLLLVRGEIKRAYKKKKNFKYPPGPFFNQKPESLSFMTTTIYDEEEEAEIRVKYICSCDEYVYEMGVEGSFACSHCDSVCTEKNCEICVDLHGKDLWSDANL